MQHTINYQLAIADLFDDGFCCSDVSVVKYKYRYIGVPAAAKLLRDGAVRVVVKI